MKISILLLSILSIIDVKSQITLADYRAQVIEYNLDLKKSQLSIDSSSEELAKRLTMRLPSLSLSGNFNYAIRHIDEQKRWRFDVQPQILQTLYGGGAISADINSARLSSEIALCSRDFTMTEVIYSADYAYWNLLSADRYVDIMYNYIGIIKSLKVLVDRRFNEGYISKGDVLMIATRLSEAEYGVVSAEQLHEIALHNFNILRGFPTDNAVSITTIDAKNIIPPKRMTLDEVLTKRGDYTSAKLSADIHKEAIRSTKAIYNPSIKVGVQGSWAPHMPNYNGTTEINGIAFLQLSSTIFHFGERHRAVAVAKHTYNISKINEAKLHDTIKAEEANGWTKVIDTQAQLLSTSKSLPIASENLNISTYSYSEGEAAILDVMQAQLSWIQIYTNALDAEFDYLVAISAYNKIIAEDKGVNFQ